MTGRPVALDLGPEGAALLAEVLALAARGPLLAPTAPPSAEGRALVHALDEARDWALRRLTTGGSLGEGGRDDDDGLTWTDLREHAVASLASRARSDPAKAGWMDAREALIDELRPLLARLPAAYEPLLEDVAADLAHCVLARAIGGPAPERLFEETWRAYRDGGWPCGWTGRYPHGRLVVFAPPPR